MLYANNYICVRACAKTKYWMGEIEFCTKHQYAVLLEHIIWNYCSHFHLIISVSSTTMDLHDHIVFPIFLVLQVLFEVFIVSV